MNNQTESPAIPELPLEALDDMFFRVGQSEDYYATLNHYPDLNELVYSALRDCAYYPEIFLETIDEYKRPSRFRRYNLARAPREIGLNCPSLPCFKRGSKTAPANPTESTTGSTGSGRFKR